MFICYFTSFIGGPKENAEFWICVPAENKKCTINNNYFTNEENRTHRT